MTDNDTIHQQQEEPIQVLAFQDEGAEEVAQAIENNTRIPEIIPSSATREGRNHTIKDFLGRVYQIDSFDWTSTSVQGTVLKTYRFPDVLLSMSPIANKINNFLGLRAGVEFIVLVNKQPFQAGNLLISYLPHAKYNGFKLDLHSKMYGIVSRSGAPRVNLDLIDATRATMCVPFVSPFVYYDLLTKQGTIGDFSISVYSALRDVSGSSRVGVRVYARFVDVDLQFPTGQAVPTTGVLAKVNELTRQLNSGPVSTHLKELKALKKEISEMVKDFANLTNHSNDVSVTSFKQKVLPNMASSDGQNETHMLALSSVNSLTSMNMGHASQNEMDFQSITRIPTYYTTIQLKNDATAGTELWRSVVSPFSFPTVLS